MKILFLGEIIGRTGRNVIKNLLPSLKKEYKIDLCFANGETVTHGKGATRVKIEEVVSCGIDFLTSGNHVFRYKEFLEDLDDPSLPIIRPANYSPELPGRGYEILDLGRKGQILLINLQGRVFMRHEIDCPFKTIDRILKKNQDKNFAATIVDFHAEATSEKQALGFYLDGKVSAVLGSHTHVATADLRILPKGTVFTCDIGMIGSLNSILGGKAEEIISQQRRGMLGDFGVEETPPYILNAVFIEITKGQVKDIKRIQKILERDLR